MRDKKRVKYGGFYARLWGLGFSTIRGPFLQFFHNADCNCSNSIWGSTAGPFFKKLLYINNTIIHVNICACG